jgi:hypothetical protein
MTTVFQVKQLRISSRLLRGCGKKRTSSPVSPLGTSAIGRSSETAPNERIANQDYQCSGSEGLVFGSNRRRRRGPVFFATARLFILLSPYFDRRMPSGLSVPAGAPRRRVARPTLPDQTTLPELAVCRDRRWFRERSPGRKP